MKPGATLGLSHGFLLGVMRNDGVDFRKDINVVLVAPKVRISHLDGSSRPAGRLPKCRCDNDCGSSHSSTVPLECDGGGAAGDARQLYQREGGQAATPDAAPLLLQEQPMPRSSTTDALAAAGE